MIARLEIKLKAHPTENIPDDLVDIYSSQPVTAQSKVGENYDKIVALAPTDMDTHNTEYLDSLDRV